MDATAELIRSLRRQEIEDARRETFAQKFLAGAELFDYACEVSKAGIRAQHPEFSEEQVLAELVRRVHIRQRRSGVRL
jgi:hypothetical protein